MDVMSIVAWVFECSVLVQASSESSIQAFKSVSQIVHDLVANHSVVETYITNDKSE